MSDFTVGKEILSYCNKCKDRLSHIIVAMKDYETIHQVQCKTCDTVQAFKPRGPKTKVAGKKTGRRTTKAAQNEAAIITLWQEKVANADADIVQKYSIREKFNIGDVIEHVKFGKGFVQTAITNEKIEVVFQDDVRTLVHNK